MTKFVLLYNNDDGVLYPFRYSVTVVVQVSVGMFYSVQFILHTHTIYSAHILHLLLLLLLLLLLPFYDPLSGTTQVSRYQNDKTILDFVEAVMMECQWHQLNHMQAISTSLQKITMPAHLISQIFTGRMPFLTRNQQHQSTEGKSTEGNHILHLTCTNL